MIIDILFAILGVLYLFIIGAGWFRCFEEDNPRISLLLAILLGLCLLIVTGSWAVGFGISPDWSILLTTLIGLVGWIYASKGSKGALNAVWVSLKRFGNIIFSKSLVFSFGAPVVYVLLQNRFLLRGTVAFRNGPDIVGWTSAGQYLCKFSTLHPLESKLATQLGTPHILNGFLSPLKIGAHSIYAIPSFTNQINGEFLLGAHRTGLPALTASVCQLLGSESIYHFSVALTAMSVFIMSALVAMVATDLGIRPLFRNLGILAVALNPSILAVTMEGGFGQLIATPFLLVVVVCAQDRKALSRYLPISILMLISFSLATYLDAFILVAGLGFFFLVFLLLRREKFWRYWPLRDLVLAVVISFIVGWPELSSLGRLIMDRLGPKVSSGWDQGRVPTPAEAMGIFNWLPYDGSNNTRRGIGLLVISLTVSLYLLIVLMRTSSVYMQALFASMLLTYSYLMLQTYVFSHDYINHVRVFNNYPVFKFSAYFSAIVPLLLFYASRNHGVQIQEGIPSKSKVNSKFVDSVTAVLVGLLCLTLVSGYEWSKDWIKGRQFAFSVSTTKKMQDVINTYDLSVDGYSGAGPAAFALMGDIHYLESTRGYQIPTRRSVPARPLAYLVPSSTCEAAECSMLPANPNGYVRVRVLDHISIYQRID